MYLVDRERKRSKNGDEGVVLDVIRITEDPSTERTAPPCSTHVQPGDVSRALIQQGGGRGWERGLQQQHDGVVVMEWQFSSRASPSSCGGGEVLGRGGAAPWMWCCSPPLAPLFIGRRGKGPDPLDEI